jgi:hypothetical protein
MLSDYLIAPSLNSLFFTGLILLFILIIIVTNFKEITNFTTYQKLSLLCILTIAIGIHGLIHLGVETIYGFNPYKWF